MLRWLLKAIIRLLRFGLGVGLIASLFLWIRLVGDYENPGTLTPLQFLLTVLGAGLMYVLVIAVHEAGHWLSGRALGFVGTHFIVLWLYVERRGTRWTVKLAKPPAKLGGMVVQYPSSGRQLRQRKFLSVAAGPGANLLTGLLALAVGAATLPPVSAQPPAGVVMVAAELLVFALFSLVTGLANLLPRKVTSEISNDGLLLWHLWRGQPALSRALAVSALVGSSYAGKRPREWDHVLLDLATAHTDNTLLDGSAAMLAYSHQLDANRPAQARPLLYACLEKLALFMPEQQQQIWCEVAYFEVRHAQNAVQAQYALTQAQLAKAFAEDEGNFARAEVLWALGDYAAARTHLQQVEAEPLVENEHDVGNRRMALDRLADLRLRLATAPGFEMM